MRYLSRLRLIREEQALSQRDLAKLSGVAQDTISQIERGERKVRPSTLRKLAQALRVEPSVLLAPIEQSVQEQEDPEKKIRSTEIDIHSFQDWLQLVRQLASAGETGVELTDPQGNTCRFNSSLEAHLAGWWPREPGKVSILGLSGVSLPKNYEQVISKIETDDPEELEDAANTALFIARNIAQSIEREQASFEKYLEREFATLPRQYFENPYSIERLMKLWQDVAFYLGELQRDGAKSIRELIELHEIAVEKLSVMADQVTRKGEIE